MSRAKFGEGRREPISSDRFNYESSGIDGAMAISKHLLRIKHLKASRRATMAT